MVDQFEETFTLCADEAERSDFVEALTGAAKRWPENVAVILAIRADYYGHCAPIRIWRRRWPPTTSWSGRSRARS